MISKLTKTEKAYIAGIVDGEGCISTSKNTNCRTHKPYVVIAQKNAKVIKYLYKLVGGKVDLVVRKRPDGRKQHYFRWNIYSSNCREFLVAILPYLQLKKNQATLAIELIDTLKECKRVKINAVPDYAIERANYIGQGIRNLNSPVTTERTDFEQYLKMQQSELDEMKNIQNEDRSILVAN